MPIYEANLAKGALRNTVTHEVRRFVWNPASVSDEKTTNFAQVKPQGLSHPVYMFLSGGARVVQFTLQFDLWRMDGLSLEDEVRWYTHLQYPEHQGDRIKTAAPQCMFTLGPYYSKMFCVVYSVSANILMWTPGLAIRKVDLTIVLHEVIHRSINGSDVLLGKAPEKLGMDMRLLGGAAGGGTPAAGNAIHEAPAEQAPGYLQQYVDLKLMSGADGREIHKGLRGE